MKNRISDRAPVTNPNIDVPTHEEIAERAYGRYLERGESDGQDLDDWLWAEQELLRERSNGIVEHVVADVVFGWEQSTV
jgi:hypothetical protein